MTPPEYITIKEMVGLLPYAKRTLAENITQRKDFPKPYRPTGMKRFWKLSEVIAWVERIHNLEASIDPEQVTLAAVEANIVRCPDQAMAGQMIERIEAIGREGDSCGGVITCLVRQAPMGLGMPVFDKLEADLAKAVMSLPATKGFEIGSGFAGTLLKGSEHNDAFLPTSDGSLHTATNNSGGIQGGISNGEQIRDILQHCLDYFPDPANLPFEIGQCALLTELVFELKALRVICTGQVDGFEAGFFRRTSRHGHGQCSHQQAASGVHATPGK